ncbi:hypothetical protein [Halostagnicola sp. A-GB9-2]|uniref:hypothetical protein n=1 Tax=Halostagnicola sp. A-GB9-2 TaxID=3048066 RepID=UPI0024BFA8D2|nr:hypothetical protein [Halostagnicola sp. A-GB9-2]MDJ1433056.1 hypothetical protein [Halostagnicola sp. A-GB9-2]
MAIRKLRNIDGSGEVVLPKGDLQRDGVVNADDEIKDAHITVDRVDDGEYRIKAVDPDNF